MKKSDNNFSLAHTTWNCKYHIVFAPKYRRKVFFNQKRLEIGAILVVRVERSRNNRGRSMPRSRAYVGKHTTKVECEWI